MKAHRCVSARLTFFVSMALLVACASPQEASSDSTLLQEERTAEGLDVGGGAYYRAFTP